MEEYRKCPLAHLGCKFEDGGFGTRRHVNLDEHLEDHDLLERSKGYEAIVMLCRWWKSSGAASCPICRQQICDRTQEIDLFLGHLATHSSAERMEHAPILSQMLRPYLSKKQTWPSTWHWKEMRFVDAEITKQLEQELEIPGFGTESMANFPSTVTSIVACTEVPQL